MSMKFLIPKEEIELSNNIVENRNINKDLYIIKNYQSNCIDVSNDKKYDNYILSLKKELSSAKTERKKIEEEAKKINYKLIILKKQEKSSILQLKELKKRIEKIIINRSKGEEKIRKELSSKNFFSKIPSQSSKSFNPFSLIIKNLRESDSSYSYSPFSSKMKANLNNTQDNFFLPKKYDINSNYNSRDNIYIKEINDRTSTFQKEDKGVFCHNKTEKELIKQKLISELKFDEIEQKQIEEEIEKIEMEEKKLMNKIISKNIE